MEPDGLVRALFLALNQCSEAEPQTLPDPQAIPGSQQNHGQQQGQADDQEDELDKVIGCKHEGCLGDAGMMVVYKKKELNLFYM